jgi:hypothetical protein
MLCYIGLLDCRAIPRATRGAIAVHLSEDATVQRSVRTLNPANARNLN